MLLSLFPFDCCGRLRAYIVNDPVHPFHFVDDVIADPRKKFVGQVAPVGCHAIGAAHCAQRHRVLVSAFVSHYANAVYGKENSAGLPHRIIKIMSLQPVYENGVHFLDDAYFLLRDLTKNADCEPWSRKRMTIKDVLVEPQLSSNTSYLVLEKTAQRLHNFQVHKVRQSSYVVM